MLYLKATGMDGASHGSSKTVACAERKGHSFKQLIPTNSPSEEGLCILQQDPCWGFGTNCFDISRSFAQQAFGLYLSSPD